ncbi:hypothetical protein GSbR_14890 [Geobacter sp. SVR]|nr:hypothetical protein GSVR_00100 [Geobacter sp. SVR]GCF84889.1 hypothetical protein GSbR_14890 [Geobacter sp. SVR]
MLFRIGQGGAQAVRLFGGTMETLIQQGKLDLPFATGQPHGIAQALFQKYTGNCETCCQTCCKDCYFHEGNSVSGGTESMASLSAGLKSLCPWFMPGGDSECGSRQMASEQPSAGR